MVARARMHYRNGGLDLRKNSPFADAHGLIKTEVLTSSKIPHRATLLRQVVATAILGEILQQLQIDTSTLKVHWLCGGRVAI